MSIDAGRLRHRVDIEQPVKSQNALTGEWSTVWAAVYESVPVSIEPLSVRDFMQSKSDQSGVSVRIVTRRLDGLTPQMRLVGVCGCHEGRIYNPQGWLEDKESGRSYVTAPCSEGVNVG